MNILLCSSQLESSLEEEKSQREKLGHERDLLLKEKSESTANIQQRDLKIQELVQEVGITTGRFAALNFQTISAHPTYINNVAQIYI